MNNEFTLTDENGKERIAIPILKISLNEENYLIYSIERDEKSDNLFISLINSSNSDRITLKDLNNKDKKNLINSTIKDILEEVIETGKINTEKLPKNLSITAFQSLVEPSKFTIIDAYLFTSIKENVTKISEAAFKLTEEQKKIIENNIPILDISKESNLQQALERNPLPETVPSSEEKISSNSSTTITSTPPSTPDPIEGITFITRNFNPDPNACDRFHEEDSTILSATPTDIIMFKDHIQRLQGHHTSEEIKRGLGTARTLKPKQSNSRFPTSTAGYITTAAIVTVGLVGVTIASFLITSAILQK